MSPLLMAAAEAPVPVQVPGSAQQLRLGSTAKAFHIDDISANVVKAEYAVRGELNTIADQLKLQLEKDPSSLPFPEIIACNIGNPQQLNQKPITFFRQVAALIESPTVFFSPANIEHTRKIFPADAIRRAETLLASIGSIGAYSHSKGIPVIRKNIAKFITKRDGGPECDPDSIFMTSGASDGVKNVLQLLLANPQVGVLIPIPQYPLYTATITLCNGSLVPYYLNEANGWSLDSEEIIRGVYDARAKGIIVKGICIINPGNPTGNVLGEESIKQIIELCHREKLIIMADEVYQTNNYYPEEKPWVSFRQVLKSLGPKYDHFELISFHSISKGIIGECGRRGGYFQCEGVDPSVMDQLYKLASIGLCPNVHGQVMMDLMTNPPQPGDESYALYHKESTDIFDSLKRRSISLHQLFSSLPNMSCQRAEGSMYLFPSVTFAPSFLAHAASLNKSPDTLYCIELLKATGVVTIPGSGFLQKQGSWHFRCTFLPEEGAFAGFQARIRAFHEAFVKKWDAVKV